jgi:hypothetical protein
MEQLDDLLRDETYDIVVCSGVLMYLNEVTAAQVVSVILKHTRLITALAGLAHPEIDNSQLKHSVPRDHDHSFIHNFDSMIARAGGRILARRWEGKKLFDGHSIFFVFATNPNTKWHNFLPQSE